MEKWQSKSFQIIEHLKQFPNHANVKVTISKDFKASSCIIQIVELITRKLTLFQEASKLKEIP